MKIVRNWPDFFTFYQQYEFTISSHIHWNYGTKPNPRVSITALGEWVWNGHYLPTSCKQGDHRESVTKHHNDQHCQWHMCSVCGVRVWRICSVDVVYPLCLTSSAQQSVCSSDQCAWCPDLPPLQHIVIFEWYFYSLYAVYSDKMTEKDCEKI